MAKAGKGDSVAAEDRPGMSAATLTGESVRGLRQYLDGRMESLRDVRESWYLHWRELAEYILPRRYRWLITPGGSYTNRGKMINQKIINSVGTMAARNMAAGLTSGTTSPSRPWFLIKPSDPNLAEDWDVKEWCEEVTLRMMRVMSGSGYYGAKAQQYEDLAVFGTAPMIIYEDNDTVIRTFNPAAGEYFCAVGPNNDVNLLGREFTQTASSVVMEFGVENVSENVRNMDMRGKNASNNAAGKDAEIIVCHLIEPNPEYDPTLERPGKYGIPRHFRYREFYWERMDGRKEKMLRCAGYMERPFSAPRWATTSNDAYGRSPGMDALGDIKQLQFQEKRKAQAIDKMVNPPMVGDIALKNEPASLLPGAITYVANGPNSAGFKPAFNTQLPLGDLKEDMMKVEGRIKEAFYNDLFLMISQLDTVRSATEIDARREEKLVMIGPALDRIQREGLSADIARIFTIMARRGLLPPRPDSLAGNSVKIEYSSLLSELQRSTVTTSIERTVAFAGGVAGAIPAALDNINYDAAIQEYASNLRTPTRVMNSKKQRDIMRKQRADAEQQAAQLQTGQEAVGAAKVLSETDIGGGQNALSAMINGGM